MTRVDQRLSDLLHAAAPASDAVPFDDVARRVHQRRKLRWSVLCSAVAVAAVVTLTVTIARPDDSSRRRDSVATDAVDLSGAVAWIDAPAAPYRAPTAAPLPPPVSDARACTIDDVAASWADHAAAGGHSIVYVRFRNTSQSTCVLTGYPQMTATQPGLPDAAGVNGSFFPSPDVANMPPGQDTYLGLETDTNCAERPGGGNAGTPYRHIDVRLPSGGTVSLGRAPDGLDVTCGLHLTEFFVRLPEQPVPHESLTDLRAALEVPSRVAAGSTLIYVVALTNPSDQPISLTPCPGYIQGTRAPTQVKDTVKDTYALNCGALSAIAAKQTIHFEMRMRLAADTPTGPLTIRWGLFGPITPTQSATINVVAAAQSTSPQPPLTPEVPPGISTCGSYMINATTTEGTVPLLSCAALAGIDPAPIVVSIGDEIIISGLPDHAILSTSGNIVETQGTTLTARASGSTNVTARGVLCVPPPGRPQPTTCDLVDVIVK